MANQTGNGRGRDEHWTDRAERDEQLRARRDETERYGGGQSGYGAGRMGDDRTMGPAYRNQAGMGQRGDREHNDDREGMHTDERFTGRGGEGFWRDSTERTDYNSGYNRGGTGYGTEREGSPRAPARSQESLRGGAPGPADRSGQPDRFGPNYGGNWADQAHGARASGPHRGKGPVGYTRSDDRIREAVCEALADDHNVDATHVEVVVKNGEVLLTGHVDDRAQKRMAEDIALNQSGVQDVQNQLRVGGNPKRENAVGMNETETSPTNKLRS